jgi:hypothetical protein
METGIVWQERKFMSKLYMDQSVKIRLDQEMTRSVKIWGYTKMLNTSPRKPLTDLASP